MPQCTAATLVLQPSQMVLCCGIWHTCEGLRQESGTAKWLRVLEITRSTILQSKHRPVCVLFIYFFTSSGRLKSLPYRTAHNWEICILRPGREHTWLGSTGAMEPETRTPASCSHSWENFGQAWRFGCCLIHRNIRISKHRGEAICSSKNTDK